MIFTCDLDDGETTAVYFVPINSFQTAIASGDVVLFDYNTPRPVIVMSPEEANALGRALLKIADEVPFYKTKQK